MVSMIRDIEHVAIVALGVFEVPAYEYNFVGSVFTLGPDIFWRVEINLLVHTLEHNFILRSIDSKDSLRSNHTISSG